eukprot:UN23904
MNTDGDITIMPGLREMSEGADASSTVMGECEIKEDRIDSEIVKEIINKFKTQNLRENSWYPVNRYSKGVYNATPKYFLPTLKYICDDLPNNGTAVIGGHSLFLNNLRVILVTKQAAHGNNYEK